MSVFEGMRPWNRLRYGAVALIVSGVLFVITGIFVTGTIEPPQDGRVITEASALAANTTGFRIGMLVGVLAFATLVLGAVALYGQLMDTPVERWAFAGLVVTVVSVLVYLPLVGIVAYIVPAVGALVEGGNASAMAVLDETWNDPFLVVPFLGGILWNVGVVLLGIAIWRSASLSTAAGITLVVGGVLGIPAFLDVVQVQLISTVVLALGLVAAGLSLWQVGESVAADSPDRLAAKAQ